MNTLAVRHAWRALALAGYLLANAVSAGPILHTSPDLNADGAVNQHDIAVFKRAFATGDVIADLNDDGRVDFADAALLSSALNSGRPNRPALAGGGAPRVYVLPEASGPVQAGDEVVLEVWFDGIANPILGGGWTMAFDPSVLTVLDWAYVLVDAFGQACDLPTSTCITLDPAIIDNTNGLIEAGAGDFNGIGLLGELARVAQLTVQVLQDADSFVQLAEGGPAGAFVCQANLASCPGLTFGNATLSLSGLPFPVMVIDPPAIDFGDVNSDATAQSSLTLTNIGTTDLNLTTVGGLDMLEGDFAIAADNCSNQSIAVNASCDVTVSFSPSDDGLQTDTFDIPSDALLSPDVSYPVSGTGRLVAPQISVASGLDFNVATVGMTITSGVTVLNTGDATLILGVIGGQDPLAAPFSVSDECSNESIAPNQSCLVRITFAPDAVGEFSDSFDIPSNDDSNPSVTVTVIGEGELAQGLIQISPPEVNFTRARPGQLRTAEVTVTNLGPGVETVAPIAQSDGLAAPFTISADNCTGVTLNANESCELQLEFAPTEPGDFTDQFDIPLDESGLPTQLVDVRGVAEIVGIRFPHAIPIVAICKNANTGQRVTTVDIDGQIDCEAAGLMAQSGEIVNVLTSTIAFSNTVLAFANGVDLSSLLVICTNRNSGEQVVFTPNVSAFSCASNGLEIIQGDPVFVTIRAPAL